MIMKERQRRGGVAGTNASARQASVPPRSITPAIGPSPALIASDAGSQKGSSAVTTTKLVTLKRADRARTHAAVGTTDSSQSRLVTDNTFSESSGEQSAGATNGLSTSFLAAMAPKFNVRK